MSARDFLADAITRRQVMIQRAARGVAKEADESLEQLRREIQARLAETDSSLQRGLLGALLTSIDTIIEGTVQNLRTRLSERVGEFAEDEVDFQKRTLDQVVDGESRRPDTDTLRTAVFSSAATLLIGGQRQRLSIDEMVETFARSQKAEIKNVISSGFVANDTPDVIARRVSQKVRGRTRSQARTVVQTAMNHTASVARERFVAENEAVLAGEKFVATLDIRTTPTCSGFDGQVFEAGTGPIPPLHYNCRSVRVPEPRPDSVLGGLEGERPAIGADGVSQVSSRKTFSGWLNDQPADFQREFFRKYRDGDAKYELFKQGGLNAKDFIDADGAEISLQELRDQNPLAWQKAKPTD